MDYKEGLAPMGLAPTIKPNLEIVDEAFNTVWKHSPLTAHFAQQIVAVHTALLQKLTPLGL